MPRKHAQKVTTPPRWVTFLYPLPCDCCEEECYVMLLDEASGIRWCADCEQEALRRARDIESATYMRAHADIPGEAEPSE